MKDVLLITPPFTQLNTPYPATAYLKGFLNTKNISSLQVDLGIEVILEIFSKKGLTYIFELIESDNAFEDDNIERIYQLRNHYIRIIDDVILFLQGKNATFSRQLCTENYLPKGSRFEQLDDIEWAFGSMGIQDKAKHLATLFLEDISDFIVACVDDNFGFSRYAERLGQSANSFNELYEELQEEETFIDSIALQLLANKFDETPVKLVCFSVPFPGNLYSAFRCAQFIKENYPNIKIAMGGGFPNTELRDLKDVRVFEFFDFITLDDGERPIELLYNHCQDIDFIGYKRTLLLKDGVVHYDNSSELKDYKQNELGTPDYSDLRLDDYISVIELANPMHSLWSDGRWNKLTMAHGCYWGKCTFCDISLDYIKLYEPITARLLVDRMEEIANKTGERGFHFVDEAAPPALMRSLALEILKRELTFTWWTNIRFEKNFTADLCLLLKASGCIAVSGGLEVASDRLLRLIDKGVTVEQVAQVTRDFTDAGIMVHAYLMYGYPTQTIQETIDSLEMVRQLFEIDVLKSGFWHQFALTAHSPIGQDPDKYNIKPHLKEITFANNDIDFSDNTGINHSKFSFGLKKSLYNYMNGIGFEMPLHTWFDFKVPKTKVPKDFIKNCLAQDFFLLAKPSSKVIWLGDLPIIKKCKKNKKGQDLEMVILTFHGIESMETIKLAAREGEWLLEMLPKLTPVNNVRYKISDLKTDFEAVLPNFELFWYGKQVGKLREIGLLIL